jgi:hypothetical protein
MPLEPSAHAGEWPASRAERTVSTPLTYGQRVIVVEVELDGSALGRAKHLAVDLVTGLTVEKRSVNSAGLVRFDIPHEANHAWESGLLVEKERAVEANDLAGKVGWQIKPLCSRR